MADLRVVYRLSVDDPCRVVGQLAAEGWRFPSRREHGAQVSSAAEAELMSLSTMLVPGVAECRCTVAVHITTIDCGV